ncbi:MAG: TRAP transporter small permease [Deltaproteobacteria bacterium]|nr:TRAP transporter small permease [Deltaproteobacteria bacterium]
MKKLGDTIHLIAGGANWIAAAALVGMMLLTCSDVVLRFFRHPIPGTYEIVGLLGTVVIALSLAYTTEEKGHISVEFIVQKLPRRIKAALDTVNHLIAIVLFGIVAWQSTRYALDLRASGEVSLTIQMPIYPFILSIAGGCILVCIVLAYDLLVTFSTTKSK